MTGEVIIIQAGADSLPLADASVDLVVTSPPYFALRKYTDGGNAIGGQVGSEATPADYIGRLIECTREWLRVLKPAGSLFVNMGDKYSTGNSGESGLAKLGEQWSGGGHSDAKAKRRSAATAGMQPKSLLGLPWRYAIACTDELGLILRSEIIWSKPNGLPESVRDRVRRSHEQVFHFVKQAKYFAAVDEIRESYGDNSHAGRSDGRPSPATRGVQRFRPMSAGPTKLIGDLTARNTLGKLPSSVWNIATAPLIVPSELGIDHFAAFPPKLVMPIILGWSPSGICVECGEGRRPIAVASLGRKERDAPAYGGGNHGTGHSTLGSRGSSAVITGYACACPEPTAETTPAIVLDPMGGTGTTALVASLLGRTAITADISSDYCRLATWRTSDLKQQARVSKAYAERLAA